MQLYHATGEAPMILTTGFQDGDLSFLPSPPVARGVWLTDRPLPPAEGTPGTLVLALEIPDEVIAPYEWIDAAAREGRAFREFLVPAEVVNRYGPPTRLA